MNRLLRAATAWCLAAVFAWPGAAAVAAAGPSASSGFASAVSESASAASGFATAAHRSASASFASASAGPVSAPSASASGAFALDASGSASAPDGSAFVSSDETSGGVRYTVTADILNVRGEPSLTAPVIGKLKQGAVVEKLGEEGSWYRIRLGSLTGWAHSDYLEPANGGPGDRKEGADAARPADGAAGSSEAEAGTKAGASDNKRPHVDERPNPDAGDGARPHADAKADTQADAKANADDQAASSAATDGALTDSGKSGPKVIGRGIRLAPERQETREVETEAAKFVERDGYVLGDAVRVRTGPGLGHPIEGHLNRGDRVTVVGREGEWFSIAAENGLSGWIAAAYVGFRADVEVSADVLRGKIIVVDPGHGGDDSGTIGTTYGTWEMTLNLSTAIHLKRELELRGATVVMTRATDEERPSLRDRVAIAGRAGGDAFVSIHYNSAPSQASGILTFYYGSGKDRPLAAAIERRLAEGDLGLASGGISFGNFHVLRENSLPAVLLELGFLTNPRDEEIVRTESYQLAAARAIALGLEDYFASLGEGS